MFKICIPSKIYTGLLRNGKECEYDKIHIMHRNNGQHSSLEH